jgi:hypothetical protein
MDLDASVIFQILLLTFLVQSLAAWWFRPVARLIQLRDTVTTAREQEAANLIVRARERNAEAEKKWQLAKKQIEEEVQEMIVRSQNLAKERIKEVRLELHTAEEEQRRTRDLTLQHSRSELQQRIPVFSEMLLTKIAPTGRISR